MTTSVGRFAVDTVFSDSILTYKIPNTLTLTKGELVELPLGRRKVKGMFLDYEKDFPKDIKLKEVVGKLDWGFDFPVGNIDLLWWCANYYHYPLGKLVFETLPKPLKRPRAVARIYGHGTKELKLSPLQEEAAFEIRKNMEEFKQSLVYGVTGSGKSMIYLDLIKSTIKRNKSALLIIPEINLTPQLLDMVSDYTDGEIISYHSNLNNSEKFQIWNSLINDKDPKIIIGVRSSIFLPFNNLGLIIVDESHDSSFKQEDRCTYNAKDVAIKRAHLLSIPVILGSATPTCEDLKRCTDQNNTYFLNQRFNDVQLPEIVLIDKKNDSSKNPLSDESVLEIKESLEHKEQVLVFINKLGYSNFIYCNVCGHKFECNNCTSNLTFFKRQNILKCNICNFSMAKPHECPECSNLNLLPKGHGTERIQEFLEGQFPGKKIVRFDRSEITNFEKLKEVLNEFHSGNIDILVGTQMISKGHNFKNVNKVIVLGIDNVLNFPDFRAKEKVFQQLVQVSGRAGRYKKRGRVVIETFYPENDLFNIIENEEFPKFYQEELDLRKMFQFPPYSKFILIYLIGTNLNEVESAAKDYARACHSLREKHFNKVEVIGPRPTLVEKRVNKYSWCILLKSNEVIELHQLVNNISKLLKLKSGIQVKLDVDPINIH